MTARDIYFALMKLAYKLGRMNVVKWLINRYRKEAKLA